MPAIKNILAARVTVYSDPATTISCRCSVYTHTAETKDIHYGWIQGYAALAE